MGGVNASELAMSQSFIINLCELLDVPRPHPTLAQDYRHGGRISMVDTMTTVSRRIKLPTPRACVNSMHSAFLPARLRSRATS